MIINFINVLSTIFKLFFFFLMNVYVLDSIIGALILFSTVSTIFLSYNGLNIYYGPEETLSELLSEPSFISSIYDRDERTVESYLNSFLDCPYNLTVYFPDGRRYFSVGSDIQCVSAVARLPSWNSTINVLIVCLRVGA